MLILQCLVQTDQLPSPIIDTKQQYVVQMPAPAEFRGDRLVQRHMDRLGGVERLHEQIYSAVITQKRDSLDMALLAYGQPLSALTNQFLES